MSYSIGNVIYGVAGTTSLTRQINEAFGLTEKDLDDPEDRSYMTWEKAGFEYLYEGVSPWYFGVNISEIDETENIDLVQFIHDTVMFFPMSNEIQPKIGIQTKWEEKLKALPEKVRALLPKPKLMVIWSSS